jgi:hypothetical protein
MRKLLLLFAVILCINSFGQEPEDDDNFDSVIPTYFIDSVYIKYSFTNMTFKTDIYTDAETIADMMQDNGGIRVATDEDLSMLLSDTIATLFKTSKKFSKNKHENSIQEFLLNVASDSNSNVLYVRVISPCQPCFNSILSSINENKELVKVLSEHKLKSVYVNYYQTFKTQRYEFIVVIAKPWFRRKQIYIIYNEK